MLAPHQDYTTSARQVIAQAQQHAARSHAPAVTPEHLLLALLGVKNNLALRALALMQVDPSKLRQQLTPPIAGGNARAAALSGAPPALGAEARQVVHWAAKEAALLRHKEVDALHLFLGLFYLQDGPVLDLLAAHGLSLPEVRQQVFTNSKVLRPRRALPWRAAIRPSPIFLGLLVALVACGLALWFSPPEPLVQPLTILFIGIGWVVSLCIHEFGHAFVAYLGGDQAVKEAGYLTLNPLKYTHPLLSIALPLLYLAMGGIGLPGGAVYINRAALRGRQWEMWVAAGGPLGTLVCIALIVLPFFLGWREWITIENFAFWAALSFLGFLQVTALIFNLIPIPPLDGFGIIEHLLPDELRYRLRMAGSLFLLLFFLMLWQDGPVTEAFWREVIRVVDLFHIPTDLVLLGHHHFFSPITP